MIGIDIGKTKFDAAVLLPNNKIKTRKFDNKLNGFSEFIMWIKKLDVEDFHVCMEATGNYGEDFAIYLCENDFTVSVVNPAQIKGFAQSQLARTKNDRADSIVIARFCQAIKPKVWQPAPLYIRELQALVRRLEALQDMHQQEINRLHVALAHIKPSIQAVSKKLAEEIKKIKEKIKHHIDQYPDLRDKKVLLETIPGVGKSTIAQVLAFMGNPKDFENAKQFSAFVGLNPKQRQSGSAVRGKTRLSKTGNASLRKAFYFPAIVAKQYNPVIQAFCERLKASGKPTMVIIGAAMRKLVHLIYGVLKSGKPFDANVVLGVLT